MQSLRTPSCPWFLGTFLKCVFAFGSQYLDLLSRIDPYLLLVILMEQLMTIDEVARYMQVSRFTVYRLAKRHSIPATKIGRQWRFQKEEIDRWAREQYRKEHRQPA